MFVRLWNIGRLQSSVCRFNCKRILYTDGRVGRQTSRSVYICISRYCIFSEHRVSTFGHFIINFFLSAPYWALYQHESQSLGARKPRISFPIEGALHKIDFITKVAISPIDSTANYQKFHPLFRLSSGRKVTVKNWE